MNNNETYYNWYKCELCGEIYWEEDPHKFCLSNWGKPAEYLKHTCNEQPLQVGYAKIIGYGTSNKLKKIK